MRLVIDPNVLVSGSFSSGATGQLVDRWLTDRPFELIVSPLLLAELEEVLLRPKFRRWLDEDTAHSYIDRLRSEATPAKDPEIVPAVTRDPTDDYLVALAREVRADYLVSGDLDLLQLADPSPPVVNPSLALHLLGLGQRPEREEDEAEAGQDQKRSTTDQEGANSSDEDA